MQSAERKGRKGRKGVVELGSRCACVAHGKMDMAIVFAAKTELND